MLCVTDFPLSYILHIVAEQTPIPGNTFMFTNPLSQPPNNMRNLQELILRPELNTRLPGHGIQLGVHVQQIGGGHLEYGASITTNT